MGAPRLHEDPHAGQHQRPKIIAAGSLTAATGRDTFRIEAGDERIVVHADSLKAAWRAGRAAGLAPKLLRRASAFGPPVFCQIANKRRFELFPNPPWWATLAMGGQL